MSGIYLYLFPHFFIVVQAQLSPFSPHHAPPTPAIPTLSTLGPTPLIFISDMAGCLCNIVHFKKARCTLAGVAQ